MMAAMQRHHERLQQAFNTIPVDVEGIRTAMDGIARSQSQMMAKHMTASARVRDLLTPAQRKQVMELRSPCAMDGDGTMKKGLSEQEQGSQHEQHHVPPGTASGR